jgi:hypothetical protein
MFSIKLIYSLGDFADADITLDDQSLGCPEIVDNRRVPFQACGRSFGVRHQSRFESGHRLRAPIFRRVSINS